jgi:chromosome segregation ATPase
MLLIAEFTEIFETIDKYISYLNDFTSQDELLLEIFNIGPKTEIDKNTIDTLMNSVKNAVKNVSIIERDIKQKYIVAQENLDTMSRKLAEKEKVLYEKENKLAQWEYKLSQWENNLSIRESNVTEMNNIMQPLQKTLIKNEEMLDERYKPLNYEQKKLTKAEQKLKEHDKYLAKLKVFFGKC